MKGTVVVMEEDCSSGASLGVEIEGVAKLVFPTRVVFPIPPREWAVRLLRPGAKVDAGITREGTARIYSPKPLIGCERER